MKTLVLDPKTLPIVFKYDGVIYHGMPDGCSVEKDGNKIVYTAMLGDAGQLVYREKCRLRLCGGKGYENNTDIGNRRTDKAILALVNFLQNVSALVKNGNVVAYTRLDAFMAKRALCLAGYSLTVTQANKIQTTYSLYQLSF